MAVHSQDRGTRIVVLVSHVWVAIFKMTHCVSLLVNQVVKNNLNPVWKPFRIALQSLCGGDVEKVIKVGAHTHRHSQDLWILYAVVLLFSKMHLVWSWFKRSSNSRSISNRYLCCVYTSCVSSPISLKYGSNSTACCFVTFMERVRAKLVQNKARLMCVSTSLYITFLHSLLKHYCLNSVSSW